MRKHVMYVFPLVLSALVAASTLHANGATVHFHAVSSHLSLAQEHQATGAMSCASGAGVAVGLALGLFSPCSFVCLALSMYALGGVALAGC